MQGEPRKVIVAFPVSRVSEQKRLAGIYKYAGTHGDWDIMPVNDDEFTHRFRPADLRQADGVIRTTRFPIPKSVPVKSIPTVYINIDPDRPLSDKIFAVSLDNGAGARAIAENLLRKGLEHFAYIGLDRCSWSDFRRDIFTAEIARAKKPCHVFEPQIHLAWREERSRLAHWLEALPKPCGVMVGCDQWGRMVLGAARQLKIKIPDQLCVIGISNDRAINETTVPSLSSYDSDYVGNGYHAAELLDEVMSGRIRKPVHRVTPGLGVVERMSSNYLPPNFYCAAKAREIIRTHAMEGLKVPQIAKLTGVSRRLLEMRFKGAFGRTINDEIQRRRVEEMKHRLRESTLSIGDICELCGYRDERQCERIFKQSVGLTLREYRRQ